MDNYNQEQAIKEFEDLKNIALNCFDKNGNPNVLAAIRAAENKAKIAGLYANQDIKIANVVSMNDITLDGEQLKLDIGEDLLNG